MWQPKGVSRRGRSAAYRGGREAAKHQTVNVAFMPQPVPFHSFAFPRTEESKYNGAISRYSGIMLERPDKSSVVEVKGTSQVVVKGKFFFF